MKSAELCGLREFRVVDAALPDPGPGEVQVEVKAVGICGSDMHYFTEGGIGDSPCNYPVVLGHEPAGVMVKAGPGVSGIDPGDHFSLEPAVPCGGCEPCGNGKHNLCNNMYFLSSGGIPGFFRERVNLPVHNLIPVPKHVGLKEATLVEPIAVALHSLTFPSLRAGETVVVYGTGPIGLLTIAALKLAGAGRVWAVDTVPHRRAMALAMGADVALDSPGSEQQILRDTNNRGVDIAFDCAAGIDTVNQCARALAKSGRLVYTAIPGAIHMPFFVPAFRKKEISFFNVFRSNHQTERARDVLAENVAKFAPLLTHARPIEEIQGAFEVASSYVDGVGKMVVIPA